MAPAYPAAPHLGRVVHSGQTRPVNPRPSRVAGGRVQRYLCPQRPSTATERQKGASAWPRRSRRRAPAASRSSPTPPLDALQPHGGLRRRRRDPDHRPRRGLLRLRRARQALLRRPLRAVLREHRPRPRRRRPGGRRPGRGARASSRTGPTPTRARSSSRPASPRSPPGTSTASSSPAAAARPSSRRSSSRASTTSSRQAEQDEAHRPRRSPTTAPRSGALDRTGITGLREPFEPFTPGGCHVPNTNLYRLPHGLRARGPGRGRSPTGSSSRAPTPSRR